MRNNNSLDQLLTVVFMLLAVASIVLFFVVEDRTWFYRLGGIAVAVRLFQYIWRWVSNRKRRQKKASELDI
ncbi:hypothetical protein [Porphyromonas levii]|uniref:Uncharacterized protein n=1 Tax=Porphyromonas levii TaxID=28114 RepID=A0A4Y8WQM9_9PORP|nr:hypothetical protein [Porphyromonas levii]MBR8702571.1 hypothetical protein [Porphyromonas levii]MBR8712497.1 hypothetical protein [Porphyromonas levii]MBR8714489.1 hypothetical protein [Porphyromonas levii]MBR8727030.1 hypothetical protein [Porphyromonas levii]MBR8729619.1 hypothetical protein [Porphyromonas levii]